MVIEIRLPPLGQTSNEMSIVQWYKGVGDSVKIAEPLLEVETDKAQVDVESAEEGVILRILAEPGDLLESGALLALIGDRDETAAIEEPSEGIVVSALGPHGTPPSVPSATTAAPLVTPSRSVQALPLVRRLAADLGVNLAAIEGTGPSGRIERADVERAAPRKEPTPIETPVPREPASTLIEAPAVSFASDLAGDSPAPPLRRTVARRLTRSIQTIPQFRITAHLDARAAQRELQRYGKGLTPTHLLLRATARALREHPNMQRIWVEDGPGYRQLTDPDVGLAVAGDDTLFVVTIPTPDTQTLPELVNIVHAAAERGRTGRLSAADQRPAAISLSNLGMYGVDEFDAIVDPDQTAILAAGSVQDRVVAREHAFLIVPQLTLTLTCDHRSVDGVQAARFLQTLRGYFESDPAGSA